MKVLKILMKKKQSFFYRDPNLSTFRKTTESLISSGLNLSFSCLKNVVYHIQIWSPFPLFLKAGCSSTTLGPCCECKWVLIRLPEGEHVLLACRFPHFLSKVSVWPEGKLQIDWNQICQQFGPGSARTHGKDRPPRTRI